MKRWHHLVWIWSTVAMIPLVFVLGTLGIILNNGTLKNLCLFYGLLGATSVTGLGLVYGDAEVRIPPRQSRLTRAERKQQQEREALAADIARLERELDINQPPSDEEKPKRFPPYSESVKNPWSCQDWDLDEEEEEFY